jgi:hypothetical protein
MFRYDSKPSLIRNEICQMLFTVEYILRGHVAFRNADLTKLDDCFKPASLRSEPSAPSVLPFCSF